LYYQLAEKLRGEIDNGTYTPASRLPTEEELATAHGLSRVTIRNSLRKLEAEGYIHRVKGKGTFVSPSIRKTRNIILAAHSSILQDNSSMHSLLVGAIVQLQTEPDVRVQVVVNHQLQKTVDPFVRNPALQTGILFLRDREANADDLEFLERSGIPYLREGVKLPANYNWLDIDNVDAMSQVVDHLYGLGHRRFGIFHAESPIHTHFGERHEATLKRLADVGIPAADIQVVTLARADRMENLAYDASAAFFAGSRRPTAIICVSDFLASAVILWLETNGFTVPGDVAVTGFDDSPISRHLRPPITTVRQDYYEIGRLAAGHLLHMMTDYLNRHAQIKVKLELKIRGSTVADGPRQDKEISP
jgi:DNA-binding LacI/PurR family transcriptional regulator